MSRKFPHLKQLDSMDCGAACLSMIVKYHGKNYTLQKLQEMCYATREGVTLYNISDAAEKIGLKTLGVRVSFGKLCEIAAGFWGEKVIISSFGAKKLQKTGIFFKNILVTIKAL